MYFCPLKKDPIPRNIMLNDYCLIEINCARGCVVISNIYFMIEKIN